MVRGVGFQWALNVWRYSKEREHHATIVDLPPSSKFYRLAITGGKGQSSPKGHPLTHPHTDPPPAVLEEPSCTSWFLHLKIV